MSLQWSDDLPDSWVKAPDNPPIPGHDSSEHNAGLPDAEAVGAYNGFILRPKMDEYDGADITKHSIYVESIPDYRDKAKVPGRIDE